MNELDELYQIMFKFYVKLEVKDIKISFLKYFFVPSLEHCALVLI